MLTGALSRRQVDRRTVRTAMIGLGLDEVMPVPFLAPGDLERAGLDADRILRGLLAVIEATTPQCSADFTLVEDTATGEVVSSLRRGPRPVDGRGAPRKPSTGRQVHGRTGPRCGRPPPETPRDGRNR